MRFLTEPKHRSRKKWTDLDASMRDGHDTSLGVLVIEVRIVLNPLFF
jgi:hypothetical protein